MVGFGQTEGIEPILDGREVQKIHANLTSAVDLTQAKRLPGKHDQAFMADTKGGAFELDPELGKAMMWEPNPHGRPNSDVIVPWVNAWDITRRNRGLFIIDFGVNNSPEASAAQYQAPYERLKEVVLPQRLDNKRESYRALWWIHVEPRPAMRAALGTLPRFIATPVVSKYRVFVWLEKPILPDHALILFPFDVITSSEFFTHVSTSIGPEAKVPRSANASPASATPPRAASKPSPSPTPPSL
jgi:hypothetical protein